MTRTQNFIIRLTQTDLAFRFGQSALITYALTGLGYYLYYMGEMIYTYYKLTGNVAIPFIDIR